MPGKFFISLLQSVVQCTIVHHDHDSMTTKFLNGFPNVCVYFDNSFVDSCHVSTHLYKNTFSIKTFVDLKDYKDYIITNQPSPIRKNRPHLIDRSDQYKRQKDES